MQFRPRKKKKLHGQVPADSGGPAQCAVYSLAAALGLPAALRDLQLGRVALTGRSAARPRRGTRGRHCGQREDTSPRIIPRRYIYGEFMSIFPLIQPRKDLRASKIVWILP